MSRWRRGDERARAGGGDAVAVGDTQAAEVGQLRGGREGEGAGVADVTELEAEVLQAGPRDSFGERAGAAVGERDRGLRARVADVEARQRGQGDLGEDASGRVAEVVLAEGEARERGPADGGEVREPCECARRGVRAWDAGWSASPASALDGAFGWSAGHAAEEGEGLAGFGGGRGEDAAHHRADDPDGGDVAAGEEQVADR